MFNRQPYNRGKFNVSSVTSTGGSGVGGIDVISIPAIPSMVISTPLTIAEIRTDAEADGTKNILSLETVSNIDMVASGNGTTNKFGDAVADLNIESEASSIVAGESALTLRNINLKQGDELVINTCNMTVTINGANGIRYLTLDSDFFSLLQGSNELIYSDNATSRNINLDLIWKDRWI